MNKPNSTPGQSFRRICRAEQFVRTWTTLKFALTALALVAGAMFVPSTQAQLAQLSFRASQLRVTVPPNYSGTVIITNSATVRTNGAFFDGTGTNWSIGAVNLTATGVPLLPSGLTLGITDQNSNTITAYTPDVMHTNNASTSTQTTNQIWLWVNMANVTKGTYTFALNGSGSVTNTSLLFTLQVGVIWHGTTNASTGGPSDWGTSGNWLGDVPGAGDDVIFTDYGGQTNQLITGGVVNYYLTNCAINGDETIGSLRFSMINSNTFSATNFLTKAQTIYIAPDKTLTINGANGFSFLRDYASALSGFGSGNNMNVTFLGTGGTLYVNNSSANFALLSDNNTVGSSVFSGMNGLELTQLGNFRADVNRMALGDYQAYPNYDNLSVTNNYRNGTVIPRNFAARLDMARTNVIRATYVDPNNFTNSERRDYSFTLGNNEAGGTSSNPQYTLLLGVTNIFLVDSICFGHASLSSYSAFNPGAVVFTNLVPGVSTNYTTNICRVYFRNTNGVDRVSMWSQSDAGQGGTNLNSGSNCKGTVSFAAGIVDALVDRLTISRDRLNSKLNCQSTLLMSAGVFDVNNAYIGYQNAQNEHTNRAYCSGQLIVSNSPLGSAVFKVNNELALGYTSEDPANPANGNGNNQVDQQFGYGQLTLVNGATLMASNITVGGLTKLSGGETATGSGPNYIYLYDNVSLIVSNAVGDNVKGLNTLAFQGTNATLTLFIDGNRSPTPYVYATNFTTASAVNYIQIGGVKNVTYTGGVATIPVVWFTAGNPSILGVHMPSGFVGSGQILTNGGTGWNLSISTNAPNTNLLWRPIPGYGTTNWDITSLVWSNLDNAMMTNFHTGDWVTFDDTPNLASNINQTVSVLLPGQITMTNRFVKYTITGSGLQGGGILTKTGTNTLDVEGNASIAFALAQGILTNGTLGTIGGVSVTAGATLINNGKINGGIVCAGMAISSGTINGTVGINGGGVVTNLSGATITGLPTLQDGALLYNSGTVTYPLGFTCTVSSNATFVNDGLINGDYLVVNGTLKDTGVGYISLYNTLTVNGSTAGTNPVGGLFIPGGDGVSTTRVLPAIGASGNYPGRVAFLGGSRIILKVTNNNNTVLYSGFQDFGPSAGNNTYNGCTLMITNIGTIPFGNGQVFTMFQSINSSADQFGPFNFDGTSTNTYPLIQPFGPGTGLAWDLKYLINYAPDGNNGKIGIIGTAVNPTNVVLVIMPTNGVITIASYTTNNSIITTNYATNNLMHTYLSWPTNHTGWRLQSQQNTLDVGLYTNWVTVFQTPYTNLMHLTNSLTTNNCWFYRMVYP